jgi:hypothetical protein
MAKKDDVNIKNAESKTKDTNKTTPKGKDPPKKKNSIDSNVSKMAMVSNIAKSLTKLPGEIMSTAEKEWTRFGKLLKDERPIQLDSTNTFYDELMSKEKRVLSTIDRYILERKEAALRNERFLDTPLSQIPVMLFKNLNDMLDDSGKVKTFKQFKAMFASGNRMIYVGILLILIAIFILFV